MSRIRRTPQADTDSFWDLGNIADDNLAAADRLIRKIDETFETTLNELKDVFGKSSKADAVKLGLALLRVAAEGRKHNWKLTLSDENDKVVKEIVLP